MRKSVNLEFKEKVTDSFLKTVSAFANYDGGEIKFGITDGGEVVGVDNLEKTRLVIEHKINDNLSPIPRYSIDIDENSVITLTVFAGSYTPYFYKSKTYRRSDTSTVEVDHLELKRLILQGENKSYDSLPIEEQGFSFEYLESALINFLGISHMSEDILKTLELKNRDGKFTNAGKLLADHNRSKGIDIVRFGQSIDVILHRYTLENQSMLKTFDRAIEIYQEHYQYEIIEGAYRKKVEKIPEKAFREAIANALVHRDWFIDSSIQVSMNDQAIVITSPGKLPFGLSEEEYLNGRISVMRNPILGNIFYRLNIIEAFGTGIEKIREAYSMSDKKPMFKIFEHTIQITLPVISGTDGLSEDEKLVYLAINEKGVPSSKIVRATGFGKNKVLGILESLIDEGFATKVGEGRGTKYRVR